MWDVNKIGLLLVILVSCLLMVSAFRSESEAYSLTYPSYFGNRIFLDPNNPLTKQGVELGRMLFYEKALSANNEIACASCHRQELSFTDGRRFSEGVDGKKTARNAMALVNLLWVRDFFWDGRSRGLEEQARVPLTDPHEMGQALAVSAKKLQQLHDYPRLFKEVFGSEQITGSMITKALAQFERTLISADAPYDRYLRGEYRPSASAERGMALFFGTGSTGMPNGGAACGHCHAGPKTYAERYHNNGLDTLSVDLGRAAFTGLKADEGRFRVVSLRNILFTAPYMHDGRFQTIEEVLDHYSDHIRPSTTLSPFLQNEHIGAKQSGLRLDDQEQLDIIAFLDMLSDSSFISNPQFSDPFLQ